MAQPVQNHHPEEIFVNKENKQYTRMLEKWVKDYAKNVKANIFY